MSVQRELAQCASGEGVESIKGNQRKKAVFTLIPPAGVCKNMYATIIVISIVIILDSVAWFRTRLSSRSSVRP